MPEKPRSEWRFGTPELQEKSERFEKREKMIVNLLANEELRRDIILSNPRFLNEVARNKPRLTIERLLSAEFVEKDVPFLRPGLEGLMSRLDSAELLNKVITGLANQNPSESFYVTQLDRSQRMVATGDVDKKLKIQEIEIWTGVPELTNYANPDREKSADKGIYKIGGGKVPDAELVGYHQWSGARRWPIYSTKEEYREGETGEETVRILISEVNLKKYEEEERLREVGE